MNKKYETNLKRFAFHRNFFKVYWLAECKDEYKTDCVSKKLLELENKM